MHCHALLCEIFLTKGLNLCLRHLLLWQACSLSPVPPFWKAQNYFLQQHKKLSYLEGCSKHLVLPWGSEVKASAWNAGDPGSIPGLGRFPWRRKWQPTPVFLPGESHGQRSLVGYSPQGRKESDMTERLHFTSLLLWQSVGSRVHELE